MMQIALLVARLLLATVFMIAGLSKFADKSGFRRTLHEFDIPSALTEALVRLMPSVEFALAMALLPASSAWSGAIAALGLLMIFTIGIVTSLLRGRRPHCRCFGELTAVPIGKFTLLRNTTFIAVAGFIVANGRANVGPSAVAWLSELPLNQVAALTGGSAALTLLVAQTWLLFHVLQQQGRMIARLDGLEAKMASEKTGATLSLERPAGPLHSLSMDSPAPAFKLSGLYGETITLAKFMDTGKPVLLVFVHPECAPCTALLPELAQWQRGLAGSLVIVLIGSGSQEIIRAKCAAHDLAHVLLQSDNEVADAYRVTRTPSAVLLLPNGTIASPVAEGDAAIRALVSPFVRVTTAPLSKPAPSVRLPSAKGDTPHSYSDRDVQAGYGLPSFQLRTTRPTTSSGAADAVP